MERIDKNKEIMSILNRWMTLREKEKSVSRYFEKNGFRRIGIYGNGSLGRHLLWELKKNGFTVEYILDRKESKTETDKEYGVIIANPLAVSELEAVEVVVITTVTDIDSIEHLLIEGQSGKVIRLIEIIEAMEGYAYH